MNDSHCIMVVKLKARWWVMPYLFTLWLLCLLMDTRPDETKVCNFIAKYGIWVSPAADIDRSLL
jgi:hypothetical protein